MKKILSITLVALIFTAGVLFWLKEKNGKNFAHYIPIKVTKGEVVQSVEATGVVKPSVGAEVKIGARMSGTVIEEPIEVGDFVKKGALIAKIDDRERRILLKIAKEELQKVLATYPKEIKRLESALQRARIEVQKATLSLQSAQADADTAAWLCANKRHLFHKHTTSQKDYRITCTQAILKKKALQKAKMSLEEAKKKVTEASLAVQKEKESFVHERAKAKANLVKAQIRLSYATIEAPFDGIITYVSTQKGETVVAGLNAPQFAKILDPKKIENRIYVDETEIGKVKVGMEVSFHVDSFPSKAFHGKIAQIYPQPKIQNSVVYYIAVVKNFKNAKLLRPEMTTHNKIVVKIYKETLRLPNRAVKFKNGHFFVYLLKEGKVVQQQVEPGISDENYTQILGGVKLGDTVLMEPLHNAHRV